MRTELMTVATIALMAGSTSLAQAQNTDVQSQRYQPCDAPWTRVDSNGDGYVSKQEADKTVEAHFSAIDGNGNGEIDRKEYVNCLTMPDEETTSASADRNEVTFKAADTNTDGMIDRDEFAREAERAFNEIRQDIARAQAGSGNHTGSGSQAGSESQAGTKVQSGRQQANADTRSQTGSASDEEKPAVVFRRYIWLTPADLSYSKNFKDMTKDEAAGRAATAFNALDADGNDRISSDEWSREKLPAGMSEDKASKRFSQIDADASGTLSKDEFRAEFRSERDGFDRQSSASGENNKNERQQTAQADSSTDENGLPVYTYRFLIY